MDIIDGTRSGTLPRLSELPETSGRFVAERRASETRQRIPEPGPSGHRAPVPGPPPRGPMTRKRAASINTEEANQGRLEKLSLITPDTSQSADLDGTRELICLCTPAPKVPRPRNAFILYRQHHQGQVVARNPGLANPDISKIIGEQWRDEPEENKERWRRLAEEEKQRHQRQYPDYRYQPRRGGKGVASRPTSSSAVGEDPGRCPKCGGRYIATPRTPSTPSVAPTAARMSIPSSSYVGPNPRVIETDHLQHHPSQVAISTAAEAARGRNSYVTAGGPHYRHPHHHRHHLQSIGEDYEIISPTDPKRRRFDLAGGYHPVPTSSPELYGTGHNPLYHRRTSLGVLPTSGPAYSQAPGGLLPGPSMLSHGAHSPGPGPMGPPPTRPSISSSYPHPAQPPQAQPRRGSAFDESLRLPPLQTQLGPGPGEPPSAGSGPPASMASVGGGGSGNNNDNDISSNGRGGGGGGRPRDSRARGMETMVMSIPYINKLKVLQKISPPLAAPSTSSPAFEARGPVIALEGTDSVLLERVRAVVERALVATGECSVRVWTSSDEGGKDDAGGPGLLAGPENGLSAPVQAAGSSGPDACADNRSSSGAAEVQPEGSAHPILGSYLRTIMGWHAKSAEMIKHITTAPPAGRPSDASSTASEGARGGGEPNRGCPESPTAASQDPVGSEGRQQSAKTPVALVAGGFSLSISDRFACRVPITDSYAPVDHWQWMATLWRGIVGPDLVVYVRSATEEELGKLQAVELKTPGIMMVRVREDVGLVEKTERRLGFEVGEWVRTGSFKEEAH